MQIIAIILYSIWIFIEAAWRVLLPFLLLALLFTIIRMIYRHKKYGYDYFAIFKKREAIDAKREVLLRMLERQEFDSVVVLDDRYHSSLVALTEIGLFLVQIFPYTAVRVVGNKEEGEFQAWEERRKVKRLHNPFLFQKEDISQVRQKLGDIPIFSYVLFDNLSILQLSGKSESEVLTTQEFYFQVERLGKKYPHIYSEQELEQMAELLRK